MLFTILILTLFAIASFVIFNHMCKNALKENASHAEVKTMKTLRLVLPTAAILLMVALFAIAGIKIIDSTEVGVVRTFGQINHTVSGGLNFVNPISDTVEIYDLRVHVRTAAFASYTKDAQPVEATVDYQYKLRSPEVMAVAQEYGSYEILETKIEAVVEEKVKSVFAMYSAMPLLEQRSTLSSRVLQELRSLEDLYHIEFTTAVVNNIDFSDAFEASVEAKMTAEQDALRAEQEKNKAVIQAQQAKEVAEIQAEAAIATAKGEAEAIRIVREALQDMPAAYIQQMYLEKWDGKLPEVMAGDSASVIIMPEGAN